MNSSPTAPAKASILIVDDTVDNLRLLSNLLTDRGYKVRGVSKSKMALKAAQSSPPDLILLDIMMPEMDGYEVCQHLKAAENTRNVPIIFLSALNDALDKLKAFAVGGVDYIAKPFQMEEVLARVENHLRLRELQKQLAAQNALLEREICDRELLEEKLRSSEAAIRVFFEAMNDIVLLIDAEDFSIKVAPTNSTRFYPEDTDILGQTIEQFFGEKGEIFHAQIRLALETQQIVNFEYSLVTSDREVWFIASIAPTSENTVAWVGRDISDRKQIEAALRQSEERFRTLVDNIPGAIYRCIFNLDITVEFLSDAVEEIVGYRASEFIHNRLRKWTSIIHPQDREMVKSTIKKAVAFKQPFILEYRVIHANGSIRWVYDKGQGYFARDGGLLWIDGAIFDISDRKQQEETLQRRAKIDSLLSNISRTFLDRDIDTAINFTLGVMGEYTTSDRSYIIRYSESQNQMTNTHEWCAEGIAAMIGDLQAISTQTYSWFHQQLASHKIVKISRLSDLPPEAAADKAEFERAGIQSTINVPLIHSGNRVGFIGLNTVRTSKYWNAEEINLLKLVGEIVAISLARHEAEVAQQKAAQAALAASKSKSEFLANMSHELRTPLTAILGLSEALRDEVFGPLTTKQHQKLATIEQSGQHLLELINDVLDLSKIESGKMELQLANADIQGLCDASLAFVRQQAHQKQIKLTAQIPPRIGKIKVDERRMRQVLINLLSNAVKFTPDGGAVWIEVKPDLEHEVLHFSIADTGIGISLENIGKLFQPFVQVDSSFTRRYAGTGLGLALVRQVVELHGGSVSLESELERGSRFTVSLPWKQEIKKSEMPMAIATHQSLRLNQVLIVEDSAPAAEQIAHYLAELGINNSAIYSLGTGTVETAIKMNPDAIILDLQLPDRSGWDVLAQLKAEPRTHNIPILIVSVADEPVRSPEASRYEYLVKPFSRHQFQLALRKLAAAQERFDKTATILESNSLPLLLLAEDNEANISTIVEYLEAMGYRVATAMNGLEAVQMAKELKPNLVLMDIQMPEMDGLEATRQLRADVEFAQTPIIALTSLAMPGDREKCLETGVNEYMAKPVSLKKLVEAIAFQLNQF
ncbi:MAG TPA: response regulator [Kamptonema sp.]|nr:response regulator [Kamptonema sp.]